jgi:hypothetical protein
VATPPAGTTISPAITMAAAGPAEMSTAAAPAAVALLARLDTEHPVLAVRPVRELSAAARGLPAPPEVKFLVVAAVSVPASFVVGHFVTRSPESTGVV